MNEINIMFMEKLSITLKSRNLYLAVFTIVVINVVFIEHLIKPEDKNLFMTNDLYSFNKPNLANTINKNIDKVDHEKYNKDSNQNLNNNENVKDNNKKYFKTNAKHNFISIRAANKCNVKCQEKDYINEDCFNNCIEENNIQNKIHFHYLLILMGLLIAFIISFFMYIKRNLCKFELAKDYPNFIENHLLEGYDLITE